MILVLDGYNILKKIIAAVYATDKQRTDFIKQLVAYAKKKGHQMIVVFDGGPSPWPSHEHYGDVMVTYAGTQSSADDYIKHYLERKHNRENILLISTDRELNRYARRLDVQSLDADEFQEFLVQALPKPKLTMVRSSEKVHKLKINSNSEALDALMEQGSTVIMHKREDELTSKKRAKSVLSKKDKKIMQKLKKL